ncbi:MAG: hypothetical protein SFX72_12760 [Isosphaeraceae bacterium]|nr:hypothetical protein [Isosphaeraceae bacterium]
MTRHALALCVVILANVFAARSVPAAADPPEVFPGTDRWVDRKDPAREMVEGLHRYFDRMTAASVAQRAELRKRDHSSPEAYAASLAPEREQLRRMIGAAESHPDRVEFQLRAPVRGPVDAANSDRWRAREVAWRVDDVVVAEGLLLEPTGTIRGSVVALPDCDVTAESFAGLDSESPGRDAIARRLVEAGYRVVIPTLLSRSDRMSGNPSVRMTNLSHREWIYRQAYEVGRHPIGYEVDMVRAAVTALMGIAEGGAIGVAGQGEGGSIALHAAALDTRIAAVWVGGWFSPREGMWSEPIDRNVWGFLERFGGAELASLVAPRPLVIEACRGPEVSGPRPARNGRADAASGALASPTVAAVRAEFRRLQEMVPASISKAMLVGEGGEIDADGRALAAFRSALSDPEAEREPTIRPAKILRKTDPIAREDRMLAAWTDRSRRLAQTSELRRTAYWSKADGSSVERWVETSKPYRERFWSDLIGKLPVPDQRARPSTIRILDQPKWTGYAVRIELAPDLEASGVLLWPKDLKPGERRPVVVCQHGLEGTPDPIVDRSISSVYHHFGAQLADLGYIVYAPQNPYIGHDRFRQLLRKANPLRQSLFSVIVRQHERTLDWLASLPGVDADRIGFYGLSYGGKTAMRVPAILERYALSICSADFNEWVVKTTNLERPYSYMFTVEYDMYEFGLAETANYAEMAMLICPRPFMVERGHKDGVAPDEWVGYEFAKVKRGYDLLGLTDRVEIGIFNDGHQIDGKATFRFLEKHLGPPRRESRAND